MSATDRRTVTVHAAPVIRQVRIADAQRTVTVHAAPVIRQVRIADAQRAVTIRPPAIFRRVTINVGVAGPVGPPGAPGEPGAAGTGLSWVVLSEDAYAAIPAPDPNTIYDILAAP